MKGNKEGKKAGKKERRQKGEAGREKYNLWKDIDRNDTTEKQKTYRKDKRELNCDRDGGQANRECGRKGRKRISKHKTI